MSKEKVILAYSGGLDTSVAITWLKKDYDVIAVCMDVGEGKDLEFIHDKALTVGAVLCRSQQLTKSTRYRQCYCC